ncbi:Ubiquinone/menaquinone biosynthesis C-methyltransferase UbiE [Pirellulimonas nuda]|uniref:Arsenite methyltransferase n=1 Tax=Pirellulimonas nuda TaxID=2528009 RepID=A0A518D6G6_9BACT|nr:arsenite methyltransferase [Pirellulimonas nuda]QDU87041.1 Ubiquinone/menaquinone biosynthesis C-methyltransferase UbiE [Pirellulimonas nuda]
MSESILEEVRRQYSAVAQQGLSSDQAGVKGVAEAFGYSADELASIPAEANMGLSCGNPTATARLRPGEVVLDLGCGGGLDVLLAAPKVGPTGRAIGVDMSQAMIDLAQRNAAKGRDGSPIENVEFHLSTIDRLPVADGVVDCVISNCVINLAPDKGAVLSEVYRALKPGGRLAVSDIALKKPLPDEVRENLPAYIGCIAGAISIDDYQRLLADAGFGAVQIVDTGADLNAYALADGAACCVPAEPAPLGLVESGGEGCCGGAASPSSEIHAQLADLLQKHNVNDFAASVRVFAVKPG